MNLKKKIIIGTANFDNSYGKYVKTKVINEKAKLILNHLKKNKIKYLDTAISYKNVDKLIGQNNLSFFNIITKIGFYNDSNITLDFLKRHIDVSLKNLNLSKVYAILLHQPILSLKKNPKEYLKFLTNLKKDKIVKKIGISVYYPEELEYCLNEFEFDIVQFPMNIFDNRFLNSGLLDNIKKKKIESHARSIFLQGVITMHKWPNHFNKWSNHIKKFNKEILKLQLDPVKASINYILNIEKIDGVVLGIKDINQINNFLKNIDDSIDLSYFNELFSIEDENFVNPSLWKS